MSFPATINLSAVDPTYGFQVNGLAASNFFGWSIAGLGDFNNDGIDDFVIGARGVNGAAGAIYVVFGQSGGFTGGLDLTALDGSNGFVVNGEGSSNFLGWDVASAGDVNGDGVADLLVSAPGGQPNGAFSGYAYVIYGGGGPYGATFDLASLDGTNGFRMAGPEASSFGGWAVSSAGDFNGDGFDDVAVTAYAADSNGVNAGATYIVYGRAGGIPANVDLGSLNGTNGFRLVGAAAYADLGFDVAGGADINHDGYDDLVVGAMGANTGYVVFGRGTTAATLSVAGLNGTDGFALTGGAALDQLGGAVSLAGDINGDGFEDVIFGAYLADPNGSGSGASYVVFGSASGYPASFSVSALDGTNGFRISGVSANDLSGRAVSAAGDVNGDGYDDLLIGAPQSDVGATNAGAAYVLFGKSGGFGANINLASLDGTNGFRLYGTLAGDQAGRTVSGVGDINGDGIDDFMVGAPYADFGGSNSGAAYLIFGSAEQRNFFGTAGADNFQGGALDDLILGQGGNDTLRGLGGNDEIYGNDGNDQLYGGAGADSLSGGAGNDILNGDDGDDTIFDSAGANKLYGGAGDDALTGGSGADQLDGGTGDDTLVGGGGNDTLDGGTGTNALFGGAGNDVYYVRSAADSVSEAAGQGTDTVRAFVSYTLTDNVETLELQGSADLDGTGNAAANALRGNAGANTLSGLAGNDTLLGGDGADRLIGGTGNDLMTGGAGADTFVVLAESVYSSKAPAGKALEIDFVYDLNKGEGDKLDLSAIDADISTAGVNDAFHLASGGFTRHAGEMTLAYNATANQTVLSLDVDGDGKADYQMKITGDVHLDSSGWIL